MKRIKEGDSLKKVMLGFTILILIIIAFYVKIFHLGNLMNAESIICRNLEVSSESIEFDADSLDSALSYSRHKVRVEEDVLYIEIYKALVSELRNDGNNVKIQLETENINKIIIVGESDELLIWER